MCVKINEKNRLIDRRKARWSQAVATAFNVSREIGGGRQTAKALAATNSEECKALVEAAKRQISVHFRCCCFCVACDHARRTRKLGQTSLLTHSIDYRLGLARMICLRSMMIHSIDSICKPAGLLCHLLLRARHKKKKSWVQRRRFNASSLPFGQPHENRVDAAS